jgi:hypothetical protein
MKNWKVLAALLLGILAFSANTALAQIKGNGLPQSKLLFNLEIIAYDGANCPQGSLADGGHRIAVKADVNDNPNGKVALTLVRENDIMLTAGEFAVLDGNACVDGVARFQLPTNPCVDADPNTDGDQCSLDDPTFQEYLVFARLVGKPKTGVNVTTCATGPGPDAVLNTADDVIVCSTESWVDVRGSGQGSKPHFENVSKELLTICTELALIDNDPLTVGDGVCDIRLALFDPRLYDYFWNWNTTGKAHAQLFFMAIPD